MICYQKPCAGCGDGDKVPATGYWRCPVCDSEWSDDDENRSDAAEGEG